MSAYINVPLDEKGKDTAWLRVESIVSVHDYAYNPMTCSIYLEGGQLCVAHMQAKAVLALVAQANRETSEQEWFSRR
jgi:hypothetical protein